MVKSGWLMWAALGLTACGAPKPQPEVQHHAVTPPAQAREAGPASGAERVSGVEHGFSAERAADLPAGGLPPGPGVYRIDTARSSLRLLVYRAGAMARLGHNHVISQGALDGWVKYSGNAADASFALRIPVGDFVVDDAALRGEEGPGFAAEVPEDARGGTRHNMLGEALLNAAHFSSINLSSVLVRQAGLTRATGTAVDATVEISVAGHVSTRVVPFSLVDDRHELRAVGTVKLRQSELGLVPFSVMLGALQVQDEFTVKFELLAVAT